MRHKALAPVVALLLAAAPAYAGTAVLTAPGVSEADAQEWARQATGKTDFQVLEPLFQRIDLPGGAAIVIGAEAIPCEKPAPRSLKGEMLQVRNAMLDMEYGSVRTIISSITDRIACYAEDAEADDLYQLFFLSGLAGFFEGDSNGARKGFSQAAALDPAREWPTEYPPTAQNAYLDALRDAVAAPPASLVSEAPGPVRLDGAPDDGTPRLLAGGHLLWEASSHTGRWVIIPPGGGLPDTGLLVTTAAQLGHGLLAGDGRYSAWLGEMAAREGWDEVLLVSEKKVVVFRVGAFFNPDGSPVILLEDAPVASRAIAPPTLAGIVVTGVGVGLAGAGVGVNMSSYNNRLPEVGQTLPERSIYDAAYSQNRAGLGMAIGGGVAAAAGIVVAVVGSQSDGRTVAALPWIHADETGFVLGIGGTLP